MLGNIITKHDFSGLGLELWCSKCDANKVHSDRPETGHFYLIAGHKWNGVQHSEPMSEEHHMVTFAVCCGCLKDF